MQDGLGSDGGPGDGNEEGAEDGEQGSHSAELPGLGRSFQHPTGVDEHQADGRQNPGQSGAENKNKEETQPHPLEGDGAEQKHQGRGAGQQAAGDAQSQ